MFYIHFSTNYLSQHKNTEDSELFYSLPNFLGVPLIDGGTVRLPQLIGLSRALDLILTGRPVRAEEALAFGLANKVVPDGQGKQRRN